MTAPLWDTEILSLPSHSLLILFPYTSCAMINLKEYLKLYFTFFLMLWGFIVINYEIFESSVASENSEITPYTYMTQMRETLFTTKFKRRSRKFLSRLTNHSFDNSSSSAHNHTGVSSKKSWAGDSERSLNRSDASQRVAKGHPMLSPAGKVWKDPAYGNVTTNASRILPSLNSKPLAAKTGLPKLRVITKSHNISSTQVNPPSTTVEPVIIEIKKNIQVINDAQTIKNEDKFGPIKNDTTILFVQVHKRLENLKYLIQSMQKVRGIEESLVVLSHDFFDPAMNAFVDSITSFRVMQMFFPFSTQLYPEVFPGNDPKDCVRNAKKETSPRCNNIPWKDSFGHYRESHFTQIKHHWWWKINRIFEELRINKVWNGTIVFLEEDHYLASDILHVLRVLQEQRQTLCPYCSVYALGNYKKTLLGVKNNVEFGDWIVTQHNMGYTMDRSVWERIRDCSDIFCTFDDYNWDWTLNRLVQACATPKIAMLMTSFSRVAHVGNCGTHIRKATCNIPAAIKEAEDQFDKNRHLHFPNSFNRSGTYKKLPFFRKPNGGWGDYRDRMLCKWIRNNTANELTIRQLQT